MVCSCVGVRLFACDCVCCVCVRLCVFGCAFVCCAGLFAILVDWLCD